MTPNEKLAKIKGILNGPDKTVTEKDFTYTIINHSGDELEAIIQELKEFLGDDPIITTLNNVQEQIYQILDIINEPEANPGDRFPHITHHEEHQHDDSDGW